jgi:hypothetical protein
VGPFVTAHRSQLRRSLPIILPLLLLGAVLVSRALWTGSVGPHATATPVLYGSRVTPDGHWVHRTYVGTVVAPVPGEALLSSTGKWSNPVMSYAYQWQHCDRAGANCANISGATTRSYKVTSTDVGLTIRAVVTAASASGPASEASRHTGVVMTAEDPPVNTTAPYFVASTGGVSCITGCAVQGETITTDNGTWNNSPTGYTYQWRDCATASARWPTAGCVDATGAGATSRSYTIGAADLSHSLAVTVTAHNSAGTSSPVTSAPTAVVAPSPARESLCTNAVTTCGYSDPASGSVGVPRGAALKPSGSLTITTNNATIDGLRVTGSISIQADNVTVENTEVIDADPSSGAIVISRGHRGTVIKHDTIHGVTPNSGALAFAVYNEGGDRLTEDHVYAYNMDRILVGSGTLTNSYCLDSANIVGGHYECVYNGGGDVIVDHDVLLNSHDQTAAVFVESYFDNLTTVQLTNSILAGGDYCLYGGSQPHDGYRNHGPEIVENNRFSRRYSPRCGQYGTDAYVPSFVRWVGNVWDDTHQPISAP